IPVSLKTGKHFLGGVYLTKGHFRGKDVWRVQQIQTPGPVRNPNDEGRIPNQTRNPKGLSATVFGARLCRPRPAAALTNCNASRTFSMLKSRHRAAAGRGRHSRAPKTLRSGRSKSEMRPLQTPPYKLSCYLTIGRSVIESCHRRAFRALWRPRASRRPQAIASNRSCGTPPRHVPQEFRNAPFF